MKEKNHDDALLIHLTVNQMKEVIESVFQQSSILSDNQPELIGVEEVIKLTGYKKTSIHKLVHERKIPFHKPAHGGRRLFFRRTEINEWLQSNRVETNEEFFQNHKNRKEFTGSTLKSNEIVRLQQKIRTIKALQQLFMFFLLTINNYKVRIRELEETVTKYNAGNHMKENLVINEINLNKDENKK